MTTPIALEQATYYEDIRLDLSLSDSEYQVLKRLHGLATEYMVTRAC